MSKRVGGRRLSKEEQTDAFKVRSMTRWECSAPCCLVLLFNPSTSPAFSSRAAMSWYTLYPLTSHDITCVSACMCSCMELCVCVFAVPRPASCQCAGLNPAKAKPNYRRMATDLAIMLTKTEEAAGRGSLGKVTAGRELHKSGPQGRGGWGLVGGLLYFRICCSHYLSQYKSQQEGTTYNWLHTLVETGGLAKPPPNPQPCRLLSPLFKTWSKTRQYFSHFDAVRS